MIRWWKLRDYTQNTLEEKLLKEDVWSLEANADDLLQEMERRIKEMTSKVLRVFKGFGPRPQDTWW